MQNNPTYLTLTHFNNIEKLQYWDAKWLQDLKIKGFIMTTEQSKTITEMKKIKTTGTKKTNT